MSVVLYTTVGCHLCEQARELVGMVDPSLVLTLWWMWRRMMICWPVTVSVFRY